MTSPAPARPGSPATIGGSGNLLTLALNHPEFGAPAALVTALAARSGTFYGQQLRAGHLYVVAGTTSGSPGDGGPATKAQFFDLLGLAADGAGNLVQVG